MNSYAEWNYLLTLNVTATGQPLQRESLLYRLREHGTPVVCRVESVFMYGGRCACLCVLAVDL